jgi:hypothetical protein
MAFTIYELCRNPEVLKKAREEIDAILGDVEIADASHMGKLEYLEMIVKVGHIIYNHLIVSKVLTSCYNRSRYESTRQLVALADC